MYEQGGKPRVGDAWCELGVRPPGRFKSNGKPEIADVDLDTTGEVVPNKKGMSVFRSLADLPRLYSKLVPIHLAGKIRGAAGLGGMRIWTMGQGTFASGAVTGNSNCMNRATNMAVSAPTILCRLPRCRRNWPTRKARGQ